MDYSDIQINVLLTLAKLTSVVSVPAHYYTRIADNEEIKHAIDKCIIELTTLKDKL